MSKCSKYELVSEIVRTRNLSLLFVRPINMRSYDA